MTSSAIAAAYHARSQSKTPLTDKEPKIYATIPDTSYVNWTPLVHAEGLERLLWEARTLLSRISDGGEPVLMEDEIEAFLEKTEIN